jgi:hypothetical protein
MPSDVRAVVGRMSDDDWESLTLQLGRYAVQKSRRFYWRTGSSGELPDGERTESIVSKAVVLWLSGRRRWNPDGYQDLQAFLQGVIDSLLSHSANGHDNRAIPDVDGVAPILRATPESRLLEQEREREAETVLSAIIRQSQDDRVILEIIDAIRDGAGTRRDIVKATGLTAGDIDNGLKRLRRLGASVVRSREHGNQAR